jgi:hypothetical protein
MFYESCETFDVVMLSYCGLSEVLTSDVELDDAKALILERLRRAMRRGCPVVKIGHGEWEIETPDDAASVSDREGFIKLVRHKRKYRRILGRKVYC